MFKHHINQARQSFRLGELLLHDQLISKQQLNDALEEQLTDSKRLGEILVHKQLLSKKQIQRSLNKQWLLRLTLISVSFVSAPLAAFDFIDSTSHIAGSLDDRDNNHSNSRYKADQRTQTSQTLNQALNSRNRFISVLLSNNSDINDSNQNNRQFSAETLSPKTNSEGLLTQFTAKIKTHVQAPLTTLLSGEYKSGVDPYNQGMAYQAVWSDKGVKLNLKYQF